MLHDSLDGIGNMQSPKVPSIKEIPRLIGLKSTTVKLLPSGG